MRARHGAHLTCEQCHGYRVNIGGIKRFRQAARMVREYRRQHEHPLRVRWTFHAAELAHAFAEQTTEQTTTNTSYVDITGASISSGSFTAGKKYLIVVAAQMRASSGNLYVGIQALHGSTVFAESEFVSEPDVASGCRNPYLWFTVWTAVSDEGIKLQFKTESGTVGADQIVMAAIKLSDDLTENTDWFFNSSSTSQGLSTTYSSSNNASVTFTPGTADHDWLVMAYARIDTGSTTTSAQSRINRNDTDLTPVYILEGEDTTNEFHMHQLVRVYTLAASSQTFTQQSATSSGTSHTRTHSGIFALNLNKLRNHSYAYGTSSVNCSNTNSYATAAEIQTTSITPDVTGDVFCLGSLIHDADFAVAQQKTRLQVDDADQPPTQTSDDYLQMRYNDSRDQMGWSLFTIEELDNSAHNIDIDATADTERSNIDRLALAFTMELPAAGGTLIKVTNETEETSEAANKILGKIKVSNETVEVAEALNRIVGIIRAINETEEINEATNRTMALVRTINETAEITEAVNRLAALSRVVNETEEVSEAANKVIGLIKNINETAEISENIVNVLGIVRVINETADVSEALNTILGLIKNINETEEIGEAENHALALTRVINETENIEEAINRVLSLARVVNESEEISEAVNRIKGLIKTINETEEVSEAVNNVLGLVRTVDESVELTEALNRVLGQVRNVNETAQITETLNNVLGLVRVVTETENISEVFNHVLGLVRVVNETESITEVLNRVLGLVRIVNETEDVDELVNHLIETVGATDISGPSRTFLYRDTELPPSVITFLTSPLKMDYVTLKMKDSLKIREKQTSINPFVGSAISQHRTFFETPSQQKASTSTLSPQQSKVYPPLSTLDVQGMPLSKLLELQKKLVQSILYDQPEISYLEEVLLGRTQVSKDSDKDIDDLEEELAIFTAAFLAVGYFTPDQHKELEAIFHKHAETQYFFGINYARKAGKDSEPLSSRDINTINDLARKAKQDYIQGLQKQIATKYADTAGLIAGAVSVGALIASDMGLRSLNKGTVSQVDRVQFVTRRDMKVCPICEALDGNIYDVDPVTKIIINGPVIPDDTHPNCRCRYLIVR